MVKLASLIKIYLVITFIALLEPTGIVSSPIHGIMPILRYLGFFIAVLAFVKYKMYRDIPCMLLLILVAWMGISTLLYSRTLDNNYLYAVVTLMPSIILSTYTIKFYPRFFIYTIASILSLWIFLDGVTWTEAGTNLTADGARSFFLGTKTTITYYLVPALAFDFIALDISDRKRRAYPRFLLFITLLGAIIYLINEPISTAIVSGGLCLIGYLVVINNKTISKAIFYYGFIVTSIIDIMFITGSSMTFLMDFFKNVLNEREGLNGRTDIWNMVLSHIADKPIIGHGYSSKIKFDVFQSYNTSTHNFFLYLLFTMGLVGFIIYLGYIYMTHRRNKNFLDFRVSRFIIYILVIWNVVAITESCGFNVMSFLMLILAANIPILIKNYKNTDMIWR